MNNNVSVLKVSTDDSSRFGLVIARARIEHGDPEPSPIYIKNQIQEIGADVVIIRLPAGSNATPQGLVKVGFAPFHADTLVYYEKELNIQHENEHLKATDGIFFEIATPDDLPAIRNIARRAFGNYVSHYHANPIFHPDLILEGYVEWATKYLDNTNCSTWVARTEGVAVAFVSCTHSIEESKFEIVLNAVEPAHEKRGIYSHLLRHIMFNFQSRGFERMSISTQIWNYAVQKIWAREGLTLTRAYDTYHINSFLGATHKQKP